MHAILIVISPDTENLSRLDPSLLSEQTLFEMFIEGFQDKSRFQDEHGNYTDFHGWPAVELCDGELNRFDTNDDQESRALGGSINLRFLPESLSWLGLAGNEIGGTICTADLPREIEYLFLDGNKFEGEFDISALPAEMKVLRISSNYLCGTLDIASLPREIEEFDGSENEFIGSINLDNLPESLTTLSLADNHFAGEFNFINLPLRLEEIELSDNPGLFGALYSAALPRSLKQLRVTNVRLSGNIRFENFLHRSGELYGMDSSAFNLPESVGKASMHYETIDLARFPTILRHLDCRNCQLQGAADFDNLPRGLIKLVLPENNLSGTLETEKLPRRLGELVLRHNRFSGEIDMQNLPYALEVFDIANNLFTGILLFDDLPTALAYVNVAGNAGIEGTTRGQALPGSLRYFSTDGTRIVREDNRGSSNKDFLGAILRRLSQRVNER